MSLLNWQQTGRVEKQVCWLLDTPRRMKWELVCHSHVPEHYRPFSHPQFLISLTYTSETACETQRWIMQHVVLFVRMWMSRWDRKNTITCHKGHDGVLDKCSGISRGLWWRDLYQSQEGGSWSVPNEREQMWGGGQWGTSLHEREGRWRSDKQFDGAEITHRAEECQWWGREIVDWLWGAPWMYQQYVESHDTLKWRMRQWAMGERDDVRKLR